MPKPPAAAKPRLLAPPRFRTFVHMSTKVWPKEWLVTGDRAARPLVILAHGAGAPMDSPFMNTVAEGLAASGLCVIRFEFPYMAARRTTGARKGPGKAEALQADYLRVIETAGEPGDIVIGGKSMGGRVASMVADQAGVRGLVCLGYPFHPPGQPEKLRVAHLAGMRTPALILQGSRDAFGTREELAGYTLSPRIRVVYLEGGDHSFKPSKGAAHTEKELIRQSIEAAARFAKGETG